MAKRARLLPNSNTVLTGVLCLLVSVFGLGNFATAEEYEYAHPGYLDSVSEERYQISKEVVIVPYSEPDKIQLREKIFTDKLTKEFKKEYERRFGYTASEQLENTYNKFAEIDTTGRLVPVDEHAEKQEKFGNYMMKELAEYHVDNYLRGNRSTRNVYKVKEKISNLEVGMNDSYKLKVRYKLSSNSVEIRATKPKEVFHNRLTLTGDGEAQLWLAYDYNKFVQLVTMYEMEKEMTSVGAVRRVTPKLSTSVTAQRYNKDVSETFPAQDRILFGVTWYD